ncbi:hypothetical protein U9M48_031201 [Paspalum notatum var. saurae]|uniref:DUF4216 domain-containing protein n=1 Tax=Paspalum notatum var. saurae TaxID=547442 RepID=A0AAQ3U6E6_PASNO
MTSAYDANDKLVNYYGVLQNIVELAFSGPKELKVVFFECVWFDPRNGTRVDKYGTVEVKHSSRLPSCINSVVLANQAVQVYYLPYPHPSLKAWWVAFKVNPQVCPPENVDYMSTNIENNDYDVFQEKEQLDKHDYKWIKGENMSKEKGASQIYLIKQHYLQVSVDWIVKDVEAWRWLAKKWSTPEWIASSKSHRENRGKAGPRHRFSADGHYSLARRMEHESGVPPSFMDVFVRGHRGPDLTNPEVLCTEAAREKMMAYGEEMTQCDGPDFDWRQAEVDAEALHASGRGKKAWQVCLWHQGCRLRPEYILSKEIGFVVWEFLLLKDSLRYPGRGGGLCSTKGGSSGNTNGQAADKHDSLHGFLPSGYRSSIGTQRELATLLPSSNVSAVGVDRVGATTPGLATTSGMGDGTPGLPATSRVDDGTPGLPDTSGVDGTAGLGAISGVDGIAGLSASFEVDGTAGLSASFELLHDTSTRGCNHLFSTMDHRVRPHALVAQLQMPKGMMT